mmetsp:Transcript_28367/g.43736  ORF Transcript_28367/g.43736 Transcript_28367/m.43736 type:complete len:89 (+) Transcript_28367:385-651(+)
MMSSEESHRTCWPYPSHPSSSPPAFQVTEMDTNRKLSMCDCCKNFYKFEMVFLLFFKNRCDALFQVKFEVNWFIHDIKYIYYLYKTTV